MTSMLEWAEASQKPRTVVGLNGYRWKSRWYKHPYLDNRGRLKRSLPKLKLIAIPETLSDGEVYLLITEPEDAP